MGTITDNISKIKHFLCFYVLPQINSYEIQIETTNYCNAKCVFCPNSTLKRPKMIMSDEVFEEIISRLKNEKINVKRFILHLNGEPLTDNKLFDRIRLLKNEFDSPIRFTTNFALADYNTRMKILESGIETITISLNSVDPIEYGNIMGMSFDKTIENVRCFINEMKELGIKMQVRFSIVARPENALMVEKFKEEFDEIGEIRVIRLGAWVDDERFASNENSSSKSKRFCGPLYKTICFLSNGDYALCCFDAEGCINKNVMTDSIMKTWKSGIYKQLRVYHLRRGMTNKECRNCSFNG